MSKEFYIYKYVDYNNEIVYIGQTVALNRRIWEHTKDKLKDFTGNIYYHICDNKSQMDLLEKVFINKYHPIFNVQDKYEKINLDCEEYCGYWINYDSFNNQQNNEEILNNRQINKKIRILNLDVLNNQQIEKENKEEKKNKQLENNFISLPFEVIDLIEQKFIAYLFLKSITLHKPINEISGNRSEYAKLLNLHKGFFTSSNKAIIQNSKYLFTFETKTAVNFSLNEKGQQEFSFLTSILKQNNNIIFNFSSKWSLPLYFLCLNNKEINVQYLLNMTGYGEYYDVKQRIIRPALNDFLRNNIPYNLIPIKKGRSFQSWKIEKIK